VYVEYRAILYDMSMRMQELVERSGLPRTTIHHYTREGLLPPARKTAPNAAEYDEAHLERLRLVTRLRHEEGGGLSIPEIREVLALQESGVDLRGAIRLVKEDVAPPDGVGWTELAGLAEAAGCTVAFAERLEAAGLLSAVQGASYTPGDLLVTRACHGVCEGRGVDAADLTPLADLIREVGHYSETLVQVQGLRSGGDADDEPGRGGEADALRRDLSGLCEALLWRSFEGRTA
jgi:DNA-binding transcriptional MerR regulator